MCYMEDLQDHVDYIHDTEFAKYHAKKCIKKVYQKDPSIIYLFNVLCYKIVNSQELKHFNTAPFIDYLDCFIYENENTIKKDSYAILTMVHKALTYFLEKNPNALVMSGVSYTVHKILMLNEEEMLYFGSWLKDAIKYVPEITGLPREGKISWYLMETWHTLNVETRKSFIGHFCARLKEYLGENKSKILQHHSETLINFIRDCKLTYEDYCELFSLYGRGEHYLHYIYWNEGRHNWWKKLFDTLNHNEALLILVLCIHSMYKNDDTKINIMLEHYIKIWKLDLDNLAILKLLKGNDLIQALYQAIPKNNININLKENVL